jgi:hypothetical protein
MRRRRRLPGDRGGGGGVVAGDEQQPDPGAGDLRHRRGGLGPDGIDEGQEPQQVEIPFGIVGDPVGAAGRDGEYPVSVGAQVVSGGAHALAYVRGDP